MRHPGNYSTRGRRWHVRTLSLFAVLALAAAACGDGDSAGGDEAAEGPTVSVGATDHGDVLVDGDGMTLYVFDPDEQGPSTCYDQCAQAWPPLLTDGSPAAGDGVNGASLATTTRDDGTTQVTYDGWPLYYWASDSAPGDATGQGVQDVWWVITADASVLRDADVEESASEAETDDAEDTDDSASDEDYSY